MLGCNALPSGRSRRRRGFTIVELMIALAIVAILSAIAYPWYIKYMIRAKRVNAQNFMMQVAQRQQQYFIDARTYAVDGSSTSCSGANAISTLNLATPGDVSSLYTICVTAVTGPPAGFLITATPISGTPQANDGAQTLASTGATAGNWTGSN